MTFEHSVEFVASAIATLFGAFGGYVILKKEYNRERNEHCSYALWGAIISLFVLQVTSTIERGRLAAYEALPQSAAAYIIPGIAMFALYSLLTWVALLAYSARHEIYRREKGFTKTYRTVYTLIFAVLVAGMLIAGFLTSPTAQAFCINLQLGTEANLEIANLTSTASVWLKYGYAIPLIIYTIVLATIALYAENKSTDAEICKSYAWYALIMGCFFIPIVLSGIYFASNKTISGFLGVLECLFTLGCAFGLAVSVKDEEGEPEKKKEKAEDEESLINKIVEHQVTKIIDEPKKVEEPKKEEPKNAFGNIGKIVEQQVTKIIEEPKKEEPKKVEEPKKEEPKNVLGNIGKIVEQQVTKIIEEPKKEEPKKEEPKVVEEHKQESPKKQPHQKHEPKSEKQKEEEKAIAEELKAQAGAAVEKLEQINAQVSEFAKELKDKGVESTQLILAIDCTASNHYSGTKSFKKKPLHTISDSQLNFYEQVIGIMGKIVSQIDQNSNFPVYLFGDTKTKDRSVRPLYTSPDGSHDCSSVEHVLSEYRKVLPKVDLAGPTSFKPAIEKAVEFAKDSKEFQLLLIIGDGAVTDLDENAEAIIAASEYPILIVMIGVGDGDFKQNPENPWEGMQKLDSKLEGNKFDNFTFVQFDPKMTAEELAKEALRELPEAFDYCKKNGLI